MATTPASHEKARASSTTHSFAASAQLRVAFACVDLLAALLGYLAIFEGLPSRYALVDVPATLIIALLACAGVALLGKRRSAVAIAQAASLVTLVAGLSLVAALAIAASYLAAIYGPVGKGGVLIEVLAAALALPYLVVFPALQLLWAGAARTRS